jgi:hypothetical protein
MRYKNLTRVLALDLHPRRFGYVVVESPDKLLDWGVRSYRRKGGSTDALIRRLGSLLELWRPSVLVINGTRQISPRTKLLRERFLKGAAAEAMNHRVCIRILKRQPANEQAARQPKYEGALAVVQRFPVLAHRMSPKRKPWESEHYSMSIFEALAGAMTTVVKRPNVRPESWPLPSK